MIVEKQVDANTVYHYSDMGLPLLQVETGVIYDEAYDISPCPYTYREVFPEDDDEELTPEEAMDILIGAAG